MNRLVVMSAILQARDLEREKDTYGLEYGSNHS